MATIAAIVLFFILLYRLGYLTVSVKRAAVYVGSGSWRSRCVGASFTGCSGFFFFAIGGYSFTRYSRERVTALALQYNLLLSVGYKLVAVQRIH